MAYQDVGTDSGNSGGTTDTAKEQAGRVGESAKQAGTEVAQTTKEQAANVVGEAKQQARDLVGEARGQVRQQAGDQKSRAVQGLQGISDELEQMAGQGSGITAEVARQASTRARDLARYVDQHEPSDLLEQVRTYARRRPVVFLAGAALAGVLTGRLTRGIASAQSDSGSGTPALPPAEPRTDTYAAYEPPAVEPAYGTGYDPTPAYDPIATPGYPGSEQPAGGFRAPEEQYPGSAYPTGQPYPATPPQADPNRGWNP